MLADLPGKRVFFREAINRAVADAMRADERVILLGQDVGAFGGSYKEFVGLLEAFGPQRVRDTPVAEAAMVGVGSSRTISGLPWEICHLSLSHPPTDTLSFNRAIWIEPLLVSLLEL